MGSFARPATACPPHVGIRQILAGLGNSVLDQTGPSGETKHGAEFEWLELWGLCAINGFFSIITSAGLEYEVKEYFTMRLEH